MGAQAHGVLGRYRRYFKPGNALVEIGCGSDSTPALYEIARETGQTFYACDPKHPEVADLGQGRDDFVYVDRKGEDFLAHDFEATGQRISAAYLDNFDWMWNPARFRNENKPKFLVEMVAEYGQAGEELCNVNSSIAHLEQSILVDRYAADPCAILFDDTWFEYAHEVYLGKGSAAVIYLLSRGWRVADELDMHGLATMVVKGIERGG